MCRVRLWKIVSAAFAKPFSKIFSGLLARNHLEMLPEIFVIYVWGAFAKSFSKIFSEILWRMLSKKGFIKLVESFENSIYSGRPHRTFSATQIYRICEAIFKNTFGNPFRKTLSEIPFGNPFRKSLSEIPFGNPFRKSLSEIPFGKLFGNVAGNHCREGCGNSLGNRLRISLTRTAGARLKRAPEAKDAAS